MNDFGFLTKEVLIYIYMVGGVDCGRVVGFGFECIYLQIEK